MTPRIACTTCGAERGLGQSTCHVCRSASATPVPPTAGDQRAIEQDLIKAAEQVDDELSRAGVVHRSSPVARALNAHCRELALVRAGVCPR